MATALPDRALGTAAHRILAAVGDAGGSLTIQQIHSAAAFGPDHKTGQDAHRLQALGW